MVVAYGDHTVLSGIDFKVLEGELTVILGPNACGKSTLLKALARVNPLKGGKVFLDGLPLSKMKSRSIAQILAMLPQTPEAPTGLTVADVVARGRYPHQSLLRSWSEKDEAACVEAMEAANVLELSERPIEALSGGQRQRVWIAMTLAQQTPLILLDEPTTYLDITHQIEVLNLTKKLHSEGHTVAVVLHDLNLAFRYATHAVLMKEGRIIAQGDPQEIVTAELIQEVFDLESVICDDPCTGTPLVVPAAHQEITIAADAIAAAREGH
ncbi:ABC transporter ATP-binding protein [Rothia dentocariosa]|jgi:ferric enterobactin transport ATP-binding protein|uniref:ABC transporter ATP-binding protein n=2 Tax=Rothia TaxID=32207 RepID=A0A7D4HLA0_9MICC|nr:ABC transporter ATP-binding protein [Rothia dentocariosa]QKI10392.1 ABC transporter ATP-binding protein [Rothia dentocariosa]